MTTGDRIALAIAGAVVTVLFVLPPLWTGRIKLFRIGTRTFLRTESPRAFWASWSFYLILALFFYVNAVYPLFPPRKS